MDDHNQIIISGAKENNLKNVSLQIPKHQFNVVTGVSGSGKSSLVFDCLYASSEAAFYETLSTYVVKNLPKINPPDVDSIHNLSPAVLIEQGKLGQNPRSTVGTYTEIFTYLRLLFSRLGYPIYDSAYFSFNTSRGACENCGGHGFVKMDMHFLGDVKQECEICHGKRYQPEVLTYLFQGKNISEVLEMTVSEALEFFHEPEIKTRLQILQDVGLGYLTLGQTLDALSGGEVQRVNMSKFLSRRGDIYVFDEPSQGLHLKDIEVLKRAIRKLIERGNSVIVVEHNLDFIIDSDYIIDMGPDAGKNGGQVVFSGFLDELYNADTFTAAAMREFVNKN